jgi:CRISPR-associated protein Cas2
VTYDIRQEKRLRQVHKTMKAFGWPLQYSVFVCDLDFVELIELRTGLGEIIHHGEDSIAIIDLGPPQQRGKDCFSFMGISNPLPTEGPVII